MQLKKYIQISSIVVTTIIPFTASCNNNPNNKATEINDSVKTEVADTIKIETVNEVTEKEKPQEFPNYEGREDIAFAGDMACKISHKGKKLIIEYLDEYGKQTVDTKNKMFEGTIIKTMCYDDVYIVVDMLDGEYSKLPFVGLYKMNLLEENCKLIDTANDIEFDRKAGHAILKTATGLAGESEADGFQWETKTINL